ASKTISSSSRSPPATIDFKRKSDNFRLIREALHGASLFRLYLLLSRNSISLQSPPAGCCARAAAGIFLGTRWERPIAGPYFSGAPMTGSTIVQRLIEQPLVRDLEARAA